MYVVESLTSLYGFSDEAANEALHAVSSSATATASGTNNNHTTTIDTLLAQCCAYILDHGL